MEAGSISFSTALDNKQLEKDFKALQKKIEKTAGDGRAIDFNVNVSDAEKKLAELRFEIESVEKQIKGFDGDRAGEEFRALTESLADMEAEWQKIATSSEAAFNFAMGRPQDGVAQYKDYYAKMSDKIEQDIARAVEGEDIATSAALKRIDALIQKLNELEQRRASLGLALGPTAQAEHAELTQQIKEAEQELDVLQKASTTAAQEAEQRLLYIKENAAVSDQRIVDLNEELVRLKERQAELQQAGVGLGHQEYDKTLQEIAAINNELKAYQNGLIEVEERTDDVGDAQKRAAKHASNFAGRLKGILASAFIFNVLSSGLRQFTGWVGKAIKSNKEASSAIAKLKGALLTLAQPLVEVIIPAFIQLVNVLTKVVTAAARVVSMLFGKTIEQSADAAENLYNEQNAIAGVGNTAEKAVKQLAAFDEINQLTEQPAPGSGGGSGSVGIAPDFSDLTGKLGDSILADIIVDLEDIFFKWDDLTPEDIAEKLLAVVFGGAGAIIGWSLGGPAGAAIGLVVGAALSTRISKALFDGDGELSPKEIAKTVLAVVFGLSGGIIGWHIGGLAGAAVGLTIGASLSMVLSNTIFDGTKQMTKKDVANSIMLALFGATGTVIGWVLGGPFGAAIGFSLGAAITFVFAGIEKKRKEGLSAEVKAMIQEAEKSIEVSKQILVNVETRYTALADIKAEYSGYLDIIDRIFELDKVVDKSPGQLALLQSYVDTINGLNLPGLHIDLDPDGKIVQTKEELVQITNELYKQAQAKAAQDLLVEAWKDYYNAVAEANDNMEKLEEATALVDERQVALNNALDNTLPFRRFNAETAMASMRLEDAKNAQAAYEEAVNTSREAVEKAQVQIGIFEDIVSGSVPEITGAAGEIEGSFSGLPNAWKSDTDDAIKGVQDSMESSKDDLASTANSVGSSLMGGLKKGVDDGKASVVSALRLAAQSAIAKTKEQFGIHSPSTVMAEIGGHLMQGLKNGISDNESTTVSTLSGVKDRIVGVFNELKDGIKTPINGILGVVEGMTNGVIRGINFAIGALNNLKIDIPDWVPGVGGRYLGFNIPRLQEISIPRLAQGAVIPPNREFLAVLGDQKSGTNIEAPAALIKQMVIEGIRAAGGAGSGARDINITLELDRQVFARAVYRANRDESQRVGVNFAGG